MSTNNENASMAGSAQPRIKTLSLEQRNRLVKVIAKKKFYMDKSYQYFCETADSYIPKINDELEKPSKIPRLEEAAENFEYQNYINGDARFVDASSGKIWKNGIDYITFKADLVELCHMILETDFYTFSSQKLDALNEKYLTFSHFEFVHKLAKNISELDFRTVMKIDNHCHCAGCAVASIILKHIQAKFDNYRGIMWLSQLGEAFTIKDIFAQIGVTDSEKITEKLLDIKADETCWKNFPNFRLKFIPCGLPALRDAFLRTDNMNGGEWYGDIIKEVYLNVKATGCQGVELRITIHGRYLKEWTELAKWYKANIKDEDDPTCVNWIIQLPRTYDESFKKDGHNTDVDCYGSYLRNIFAPLFENSAKEVSKMTPDEVVLSDFLARIKGFDSVGEEEVNETFVGECKDPDDWITNKKPPYHYELFHLFSNMAKLNSLRRKRGLNTYTLKPHSGEVGNFVNLAAAFFLGEAICHGTRLHEYPLLSYVYMLTQTGISMALRSNSYLCQEMGTSPLKCYLYQGHRVTLGSDDPMQFSNNKDPLLEEYQTCHPVLRFSDAEMSEFARTSIVISCFTNELKGHWLSNNFQFHEFLNDPVKTNVSKDRIEFRISTLKEEWKGLTSAGS